MVLGATERLLLASHTLVALFPAYTPAARERQPLKPASMPDRGLGVDQDLEIGAEEDGEYLLGEP